MVGSWSSGKRWLMNCMVMAWKQEARVTTHANVTQGVLGGASIALAHSWPDARCEGVVCGQALSSGGSEMGGRGTYRSCPRRRRPASPACTRGRSRRGRRSPRRGARRTPWSPGGARGAAPGFAPGLCGPVTHHRFSRMRTQRRRGSLLSAAPAPRGGGAEGEGWGWGPGGGVSSRPPAARTPGTRGPALGERRH